MNPWRWFVVRHPIRYVRLVWEDYRLAWWWERNTGMKP